MDRVRAFGENIYSSDITGLSYKYECNDADYPQIRIS